MDFKLSLTVSIRLPLTPYYKILIIEKLFSHVLNGFLTLLPG